MRTTASTSIVPARTSFRPSGGRREGGDARLGLALGADARDRRRAASRRSKTSSPRLAPVDLVLIEGFHTHRHPAIEVHRPSEGHALMWREGSDIIAVAQRRTPAAAVAIPVLDLNDTEAIADFVLAKAEDHVSSRL